LILRYESHRPPVNCEELLVAKKLPKNDLQKSSKIADFQQENHPGRNPQFSATTLCPIFTRISAVLDLPRPITLGEVSLRILSDAPFLLETVPP
jgi:hypothetical protein